MRVAFLHLFTCLCMLATPRRKTCQSNGKISIRDIISISKYIFDLMIINCGIDTWVEQAW